MKQVMERYLSCLALSERRLRHSIAVMESAVKLADRFGADAYISAVAGLLHDITKEHTYEWQLEFVKRYQLSIPDEIISEPKVIHAATGAYYIRLVLGVTDEEVFNAVYYHTVARAGMSRIEEAVYLADSVEPGRKFDGVGRLRELCGYDLDRAMLFALDKSIERVQKHHDKQPFRTTLEAREYYQEKIRRM